MHCPDCSGRMPKRTLAGTDVRFCEGCRVLWLAQGGLEKFRGKVTSIPAPTTLFVPDEEAPGSPCPYCSRTSLRTGTCHSALARSCSQCNGLLLPLDALPAMIEGWKASDWSGPGKPPDSASYATGAADLLLLLFGDL